MASIVLYTTMFCPFCSRAKGLLEAKGVSYTEIDVGMDSSKRREMMDLAGGATRCLRYSSVTGTSEGLTNSLLWNMLGNSTSGLRKPHDRCF